MEANESPEKLYLIQHNRLICYCRNNNEDIEYCFYDMLNKAWDKMVEQDKKKVFDEYDKKVKEFNL